MSHDPLCVEPQTDYPCKRCWEIECECLCICDILAKARRDEANRVMQLRYQEVTGWQDMKEALAWQQGQRDMLAKCIATVETAICDERDSTRAHIRYDCCGCSTIDAMSEDAIAALRALQEKP
jgi:hypothetical protein